jgi:hypothetical protein
MRGMVPVMAAVRRRRRGVQRGALPHLASGGHGNDHQWLVRNAIRPKRPRVICCRPIVSPSAATLPPTGCHVVADMPPTFRQADEGVHGGGIAVPLARARWNRACLAPNDNTPARVATIRHRVPPNDNTPARVATIRHRVLDSARATQPLCAHRCWSRCRCCLQGARCSASPERHLSARQGRWCAHARATLWRP